MSPVEVDAFLDCQGMADIADQPLRILSAIPDQPLPAHLPPSGHITTLRILLTHHLDLRCSPRKSFFEWLRRLSQDEREQERLDEFIFDPVGVWSIETRIGR
jgi:sulfite reductase alpha subunit-like flavoprotein